MRVVRARNVDGFVMTDQDKRDVIAFLQALTDSTILRDRRFADPWRRR
ncbi:MAG: hypothetical protein IT359_12060 [Gemmatimonadaceae bacterium]|nr:hypothetical protein [Gemmatimonadaceae bacterium]